MKTENKILHVEDNADDRMLVELAFRRAGIHTRLETASDGEEAMAMLLKESPTTLPACILLDMKLPGKSGLDLLEWIRAEAAFKQLPVILFTSSRHAADVNRAYELGANSYLEKPSDLSSLVELIKAIDLYWVRTNIRSSPRV
jgi:CheY-like chemotaxis protein